MNTRLVIVIQIVLHLLILCTIMIHSFVAVIYSKFSFVFQRNERNGVISSSEFNISNSKRRVVHRRLKQVFRLKSRHTKNVNMLAMINRLLEWFKSLFWKEEMELTLVIQTLLVQHLLDLRYFPWVSTEGGGQLTSSGKI